MIIGQFSDSPEFNNYSNNRSFSGYTHNVINTNQTVAMPPAIAPQYNDLSNQINQQYSNQSYNNYNKNFDYNYYYNNQNYTSSNTNESFFDSLFCDKVASSPQSEFDVKKEEVLKRRNLLQDQYNKDLEADKILQKRNYLRSIGIDPDNAPDDDMNVIVANSMIYNPSPDIQNEYSEKFRQIDREYQLIDIQNQKNKLRNQGITDERYLDYMCDPVRREEIEKENDDKYLSSFGIENIPITTKYKNKLVNTIPAEKSRAINMRNQISTFDLQQNTVPYDETVKFRNALLYQCFNIVAEQQRNDLNLNENSTIFDLATSLNNLNRKNRIKNEFLQNRLNERNSYDKEAYANYVNQMVMQQQMPNMFNSSTMLDDGTLQINYPQSFNNLEKSKYEDDYDKFLKSIKS